MIKSFEKFRKLIYVGLFLFGISVFLAHYLISGQAVYGDGIGYYSHLHSFVIDRDFNYTNEYKHIYDNFHNNVDTGEEAVAVQIIGVTKDGQAENFYGTGVAVLLLPFYFAAHLVSIITNILGGHVSLLGYSDIYQIFSGIGAVFYTVLGLYFLEKTIVKVIGNRLFGLISSVTIFFSTSLLYYGSFDVINSHFASFFLVSLFFFLLITRDKRSNLLLGIVAGLLTINRLQDSIVVLIWVIDLIRKRDSIKSAGKFIIGYLFALIPMVVHWNSVIGNPLNHPYLRGVLEKYYGGLNFDLWGSLFDPVTGLFFRTPILLVLFLYFIYLVIKKDAKYLLYPFLFFIMQFIIVTAQGGWEAAAYGGRMYISSLVFFGLILGKLLLQISRKSMVAVYVFISMFIVSNFFSMLVFILRDKGAEGGNHGTEQRTIQRIESLFKVRGY